MPQDCKRRTIPCDGAKQSALKLSTHYLECIENILNEILYAYQDRAKSISSPIFL